MYTEGLVVCRFVILSWAFSVNHNINILKTKPFTKSFLIAPLFLQDYLS
jgi:hypothetical protein